jgi:bacterioferritin
MHKETGGANNISPEILDLLNKALQLEYTLIIHYPRLANSIKDSETRKLVQNLGTASVHHADVVADAITQLGGTPDWSFTPFPDDYELVHIFQIQLQKEKQALQLHQQAADLVPPGPLVDSIKALANEEKTHISIVERVISKLKNS